MLKRNKKTLTILLVFIVCLTVFFVIEYRQEFSVKKAVTVTLWHYHSGKTKKTLDDMIEEFNHTVGAQNGIAVKAYGYGDIYSLSSDIYALLQNDGSVSGQKIPDMVMLYPEAAYRINKIKPLVTLNDYFNLQELSEYQEEFLAEGMLDGKLKILPIAKSAEVLFLNLTDWQKFAVATKADITDLETWEGLAKVSAQYYEYSGGKAFFGVNTMENFMNISIAQLNEQLCQKAADGSMKMVLSKQAMQKIWDNFYTPYIKGHYNHLGKYRSDDIRTGDLVAYMGSTGGAVYFPDKIYPGEQNSYDIKGLILPQPYYKDYEPMMLIQGAGVCILQTDKKAQEASAFFLKWLTDNKQNMIYTKNIGYMPVKKQLLTELYWQQKSQTTKNNIVQSITYTIPAMMQTHKITFNKAYQNSYAVNEYLKIALIDKAMADKNLLLQQVANGADYQTVLANLTGPENFNAWYQDVHNKVTQLANKE